MANYPRDSNYPSENTNSPNLYPILAAPTYAPYPANPIDSFNRLPPLPQTNPINYRPSNKLSQIRKSSKKQSLGCCLAGGLVSLVICAVLAIGVYFIIKSAINSTTTETSTTETTQFKCSEGLVGEKCEIKCGIIKNSNNFNRIVGGQNAVANSWPSIALVIFTYRIDSQTTKSFTCGGTLLDKKTVLTAAHCINKQVTHNGVNHDVVVNQLNPSLASMYSVNLGVHDVNVATNTQFMKVAKIYVHESYSETTLLNDIAIFKLTEEVSLNNYVQVACLPTKKSNEYPVPEEDSYAAGWGTLASGGTTPDILNDVKLTIYRSSRCKNVGNDLDWDSQICAGDITGNKDTCQGDSGGPLYVEDSVNDRKVYVAAGIVSFGVGCATVNLPAVYTRTSHYLDWIYPKLD